MANIGAIVMNVADIRRASKFWSRALDYVPREGDEAVLAPSSGEGPLLWLDEEDRTHIELWTAHAEEQRAEVERLISLGAKRVDWTYPDDANFVVLADTEGNLFCVINADDSTA